MQVKKKNGSVEIFDHAKINKSVQRLCAGLNVSASEIILNARIPEKAKRTIPSQEIKELIELSAASETWKNIDASYVAARQRLDLMYEKVFGAGVCSETFLEDYRAAFVRGLKKAVKQKLFSPNVLTKFDLERLKMALKPERDEAYLWHSLKKLESGYLAKDRNGKIFELPQTFHMRVAMGVSMNEEDPTAHAIKVYEIYSTFRAAGSSPTLFNTCSTYPQLSSCYLQEVPDSTDGIMDGIHQAARKSKHAGGLGFHMSKIRACGAAVTSTNGESSGIIPFIKLYNQMLIAFNQSGKRPGAGCVYIEPWHLDVEDFMELRRKDGDELSRAHQINTAIWYPDLFFKRLEARQDWTLFCPSEVADLPDLFSEQFETRYKLYERMAEEGKIKNFKKIPAVVLWRKHIENLFETGHPWITYKDNANERFPNRHRGVIHGSNLCTEIFLSTKQSQYAQYGNKEEIGETAVCNLSSINLDVHTSKKGVNWDLLKDTVKAIVRCLDNVIDINFYPTEESKNGNDLNRPVGLGVMGWFEMYTKLGIPQDSTEAIALTSQVMEFISYHAIITSHELSKERGIYKTFEGSDWSRGILPIDTYNHMIDKKENSVKITVPEIMDWAPVREMVKNGMRNSCLMAIAPNASISYLLGCTASVEAPFAIIASYDTGNAKFNIATPIISDILRPFWSSSLADKIVENRGSIQNIEEIPNHIKLLLKTAYEVDATNFIMVNAARQKWIDQGISFNMYFETKSPKVISEAYKLANRVGLKSTYYFYGRSASETRKIAKNDDRPDVPIWIHKGFSTEEEWKAAAMVCSLANPGSCQSCEG